MVIKNVNDIINIVKEIYSSNNYLLWFRGHSDESMRINERTTHTK